MSQSIIDEVTFLLHSFLMGILITFVYDGFIIMRRLIRHNLFLISVEDLIFWIACAIGVFYMLYEENNGILRWFAVFGAALGDGGLQKECQSFFGQNHNHGHRTCFSWAFLYTWVFVQTGAVCRGQSEGRSLCSFKKREESRQMPEKAVDGKSEFT